MRVRRDPLSRSARNAWPRVLPVALILGVVAGCGDRESRRAGEDVPLTAAIEDVFSIGGATFGPNGLMAYIETDELDVPSVRVVRLVGLGSGSSGTR